MLSLLKYKKYTLLTIVVLSIGLSAWAGNKEKVTVEITYEDQSHPSLIIETNWKEGLTALEALQFVAEVKTHPVGQYVFVSEINGIAGIPNKSVWYYQINGTPAKIIAINQPVKNGDTITWIYKQDVCSPIKNKN